MFNSFLLKGFFLFVPALTALLAIRMRLAVGPFWLSTNSDPAYIYLVNALYPFKGIAPYFTDHPGTTLQTLLHVLFRILNFGKRPDEIIEAVLRQPEFYLNTLQIVLWILFFGSLVFVGLYAYRLSGSKTFSILMQSSAFFYLTLLCGPTVPVIAHINAEPLMITIVNLLALALMRWQWKREESSEIRQVIILAVICGAGIATKFTFGPILLFPLILVLGWKKRFIFLGVTFLSFFVFVLPIWSRYPQVWAWLKPIFLLSKIPEKSSLDLWGWFHVYFSGWKLLWQEYGFLLVFNILALGLLIYRRRKKFFSAFDRVILAGTLTIFLQLAVVALHPGPQYLTAGLGVLGMVLAFSYLALREFNFRWVKFGGTVFLCIFILFQTVNAVAYAGKLSQQMQGLLSFYQDLRQKYPDYKFIGYYRSSGPEISLRFGDMVNDMRVLGKELNQIYPQTFFFHPYTYRVSNFLFDLRMSRILSKSPYVIFEGSCGYPFEDGPYETELIGQSSRECAYRLIKSTEEEAFKWFILGDILRRKGAYDEAYLAYKKCLDLRFYRPTALAFLESVCQKMKREDTFQLCGEAEKQ